MAETSTAARRAAVLGRPVLHSLSPLLHRAAYAALGLRWSYEAIDCGIAELPAVLAERSDWAGFSCTMPLKRVALASAAEVAPIAAAVGAANTLLPRVGGGWIAENTDVTGIARSLQEAGVVPGSVTVLGAGGTAQAAVAALAGMGVMACTILVRDETRTQQVLVTGRAVGVEVTVAPLGPGAPTLAADLVVSTLPGTAADLLAEVSWRPGQVMLDVVYDPWPTQLATRVAAAGGRVLSGALMLLHQAEAQVELMTGMAAPVEAMRSALRAASPGAGL